jgi:hypothetical protein
VSTYGQFRVPSATNQIQTMYGMVAAADAPAGRVYLFGQ